MAKKKTAKRKKPIPGVNPDRPFPPSKSKSKSKKKNSSTRKIRGTTAKTIVVDEFSLLPLECDLSKNTKIKKNIFKRFKDWFGNAWFVFFNSYGG